MQNLRVEIYRSSATVFSLKELAMLVNETSLDNLKARINYHVKKGEILAVRRGIYAKEKYNPLELANKIFTPSYISLETVLREAGIIFQYYRAIFAVSYLAREIKVNGQVIRYRKIKDRILSSPGGLKQANGYTIAVPERAFLDALYLYKSYHFDNLAPLNQELVFSLMETVYKSNNLAQRAARILGRINA